MSKKCLGKPVFFQSQTKKMCFAPKCVEQFITFDPQHPIQFLQNMLLGECFAIFPNDLLYFDQFMYRFSSSLPLPEDLTTAAVWMSQKPPAIWVQDLSAVGRTKIFVKVSQ